MATPKPVKPGDRKSPDQTLLDKILEGSSQKTKDKILQILLRHKIKSNDPMFLALAAITDCQLSIRPIPQELVELKDGIQAASRTLCEQVETSIQRHEELNYDFYVTAERLSTVLNQKRLEIEQYQQHRQSTLSLSFRAILLWCFVLSGIGGIVGALLISTIMLVAAAQ